MKTLEKLQETLVNAWLTNEINFKQEIYNLAGPANINLRMELMEFLTNGEKRPKTKCGVSHIEKVLREKFEKLYPPITDSEAELIKIIFGHENNKSEDGTNSPIKKMKVRNLYAKNKKLGMSFKDVILTMQEKNLLIDEDEFLTIPQTALPVINKYFDNTPAKQTPKKETPKKETPTKSKSKPGVITTIVSLIEKSGKKGVSKDKILQVLIKNFPEREEKGMKNTINVQVPNRISKERFKIIKLENGNYAKA